MILAGVISLKFWKSIPLAVKILIPGLALVFFVFTGKPKPEPKAISAPPPPQVDAIYAQPNTTHLTVHSQGTVAPKREIDLVAQVAGKIVQVTDNFVDGGFFTESSQLIKIDDRDYQFALKTAKANLRDAEQLLATERGRAKQAQREWRDLGNKESNDLFLRKPQLIAAEAKLASAEASVNKAKLDLERTEISVPFSGRIRHTHVDIGQYVSPGTKLAEVYDTSVAQIRLPLSDRQAALVDLPLGFQADNDNPGAEVAINGIIGGENYQWQGRIVRTDASIDTRSRMYFAVAEVIDPFNRPSSQTINSALRPKAPLIVGLFVEANIAGRKLNNVVVLPRSAVFKRNRIYSIDQNNTLIEKTIRVLHSDPETIWVRGDIQKDEAIVIDRQSFLRPGQVVAIRQTDTNKADTNKADTNEQALNQVRAETL